ncbi:mediator of RNA polymerase II transcription subunit 8 isoform X2 [Cucumis melo var. makuwa]|uniref:Mediator of RNA polymerase II transcription subunit 8 isoform X2 n=1 Tax=Cucumis melo var. makuwa TaxID=1194695 RepID=A0A5D3DC06_CUCMM|nr:mediator of RNA polymerase II transcription subunit 8 isoform X2 [Cucumis melo var. makuwa]TYK21114.1 mediator of RNA polymerase II transcription subunit 8 isoform X2 [Cucumis melo var. makuwa]
MLLKLREAIRLFEWCSDQKVNWEKSVLSGVNVPEDVLLQTAARIGCKAENLPIIYLGWGLGLGGIKILNSTLLAKWGWRYSLEDSTFWRKIISRIHGKEAFDWFTVGKSGNSLRIPWVNISRVWKSMEPLALIKLGNGSKISFCADILQKKAPNKCLLPSVCPLCQKLPEGPPLPKKPRLIWLNLSKALLSELWFERNQHIFHGKEKPRLEILLSAKQNAVVAWCSLNKEFGDYSIQNICLNWHGLPGTNLQRNHASQILSDQTCVYSSSVFMGGGSTGGMMPMQQQQQQQQAQLASQGAFGNMPANAQSLQSGMVPLQNMQQTHPNFGQQRQQNQQ